jgi:hypothetical protein
VTTILNYLKQLWIQQPVRVVLYTILTGLVGVLLVKYGIDGATGDLIDAIVAALLGVPATELVRSQVKPTKA